MKLFLAAFCTLPLLAGPQSGPDPRELVKRALNAYSMDEGTQRQYTYEQRDDVRVMDGSGNLKRHELKTYDVSLIEGSPYKRLVKRDDHSLSPEEEKQQQDALNYNLDVRHRETPDQRRVRIAEFERKRQDRRGDLDEVPNAFDFKLVGEDVIDGVPAWIVEGTPRPNYRAKCKSAAYFAKLKGRIWISKADNHVMKIDALTLDTISIGAFVLRIAQGGHIAIDFGRVSDAWLPKHVALTGSARLLFIKGYQLNADYSFTNYKKVPAETGVAEAAITRPLR